MGNKKTTCFISFNIISLMCGLALFAGGLVIQYYEPVKNVLLATAPTVSESKLGTIALVMIIVGLMTAFISLVGCCGALNESSCLLSFYLGVLGIMLLCQMVMTVLLFVYGSQELFAIIKKQFGEMVRYYGTPSGQDGVVDSTQQFFGCCGAEGVNDYSRYQPPQPVTQATTAATIAAMNVTSVMVTVMASTIAEPTTTTNATPTVGNYTAGPVVNATETTSATYLNVSFPDSCCKYPDNSESKALCHNQSLSVNELMNYVYLEGCASKLEEFLQRNSLIIGGVCTAIVLLEVITVISACIIRRDNLD